MESRQRSAPPIYHSRPITPVVVWWCRANRMPAAGKIYRQIGELEEKIGNMKAAMEAYNMAAEIFYV